MFTRAGADEGLRATVAVEPTGGIIRLFQVTNAVGEPAPAESVHEVKYEGLRSISETVMDFLRPLSPRETEHLGVFTYTDPAHGAGWLRMEQFRKVNVSEVQEGVRTWRIEAAVGESEPGRQEVLSFGNAIVNRTTNPYFKVLAGLVFLGLAAFGLFRMLTDPSIELSNVIAAILAAGLAAVSIVLIVNGLKRRAWWHRARAEARRQQVELPDRLKIWN